MSTHTKKEIKKPGKFIKFILIYSAVTAAIMLIVWTLLFFFIRDYENGRPSNKMDQILSLFTQDQIDKLLHSTQLSSSEFEDADKVSGFLKEQLAGKTASYKKVNGEYSDFTPVYMVYADQTPIAKVILKDAGKNFFRFTKWKLDTVSVGSIHKNSVTNSVTLTVPSGSTVTLNGIPVSDSYIKEDKILFDPCRNVAEFVATPTKTRYEITGLLTKPDISVTLNDTALTVTDLESPTASDIRCACDYPDNAAMREQRKSEIIEVAETYGKYLINRTPLDNLQKHMTGKAKSYMSNIPAVWAFLSGKQYTYEFRNENISSFRKYSEDCFSCNMYYDLYVDWEYGNKTYQTSITYTFVKTDGQWYVADFIIN